MYRIAGVSSLDYLDLYRKFTYSHQSSNRLDHIGTLEVGLGKVEYEGTLDDLYMVLLLYLHIGNGDFII